MPKFSKISKEEFERLIKEGKIQPMSDEEEQQDIPDGISPAFNIWYALEDGTDVDSSKFFKD